MTLTEEYRPQGETHWSTRTMAGVAGVSKSTVHRVWQELGLNRTESTRSRCPTTRSSRTSSSMSWVCIEPAGERDRVVRRREVLGAGA